METIFSSNGRFPTGKAQFWLLLLYDIRLFNAIAVCQDDWHFLSLFLLCNFLIATSVEILKGTEGWALRKSKLLDFLCPLTRSRTQEGGRGLKRGILGIVTFPSIPPSQKRASSRDCGMRGGGS